MKNIYAYLASCALLSQACFAADTVETDLLMSLQEDMQHYSDIATETKHNVDYMPYVISVLKSTDLEELGILNLREAISLIPGVDLNVGMAGVKNPIFRGSNPYAFGQSRLVIDGMVVNDQIFGGYNQYLDMPIDIIHRIEVVRGPGSMLKHVNGYAGSIHVITKANRDDGQKTSDSSFLITGSDELISGGIIKSFDLAAGRFSSDIYYQQHDLHLPVGDDRIPLPPSSGNTDQSLKNYQIGLNYEIGGLSIKSRFSQNDSGVSYGQAFSLTDDESDYLDVGNNSIQITYVKQLSDLIGVEFSLDYFDETRELQNKVMPDGAMMMMTTLANGRYFLVDYNEQTLSQRIQLNIDFSSSHTLNVGINLQQSEITNNDAATSDDNLLTFNEFNLFSNSERDINTLYIEDMFDVNNETTIQLGGKLTHYNDVDDQSSIRFAVVHRYNDENIFKMMFSQAYREPSWREQYLTAPSFFLPNSTLETEKVDAYELSYIKKLTHRDFFKLNTFLLKNSDQIDAQNVTRTFTNTENNDLYGFEIEFERNLFNRDLFNVNYSYINGSNVSGEMVNSAQNLVNAYYLYRATEQWGLSGLVKYIGTKDRTTVDSRESVNDYTLLDLSATYQDTPSSIKFNLAIKNVFDKTYYLPSPNATYPGDFEQPGRVLLLRLSKEF